MVLKNKYFISGLLIYIAAVLYLHFGFQQSFNDILPAFLFLGVGFSSLAWFLTKEFPVSYHKMKLRKEEWLLLLLVSWIVFYITYGGSLINQIIPKTWQSDEQVFTIIVFIKKFLFFVIVPFILYRASGFSLKDFGLTGTSLKFFNKKALIIFLIFSAAAILFQYFFSESNKKLQEGHFTVSQLSIGMPLVFIYLVFDAGLIEEFFFRGLLQSRLSVMLKSSTGAIIISALIFGLVHAPGLYLRGAESEGVSEQLPLMFWGAYCIVYMSVAGIFLGIIYSKTKNLWLLMAIHAMVDLLPNAGDFIKTWYI